MSSSAATRTGIILITPVAYSLVTLFSIAILPSFTVSFAINSKRRVYPSSLHVRSPAGKNDNGGWNGIDTQLYNAMPMDDQFYDGYDVFIQGLQADLESDSFDIYDDDHDAASTSVSTSADDHHQDTNRNESASASTRRQPRRPNHHHRGRNKNQQQHSGRKRRKPGYRRDPTDDMSKPINESEIYRLIAQRSKAQKDRNYVQADDILHELNHVHGVYVWDKDGLWSVSPIAPSRRYKNYAASGDGKNGGDAGGNGNGSYYRENARKATQFGRNGHDYTQIGGDIDESVCSLRLHEIHRLIAKRLGHKLMREYDKADEIQATLYKNGVKIHDKLRQWRADGGTFDDVDAMLSGKPFKMNPYSDPIEDEEVLDEVEEVVAVRDEARTRSDYAEADRLRQVLWDRFRVAVDDKTRTFSKNGDFGIDGTFRWTDDGPINPRRGRDPLNSRDWRIVGGMYTKSPYSDPLDGKDEEEVNNLIHDRLEAKRVRDFEVADLIQNHLFNQYTISVDDQLRQWSVGGLFDESEMRSLRKNSPTASDGKSTSSYIRKYNRRGGTGHLSEGEIQLVEAMVQRRSEEMSRFNRQAAHSILQGLRRKYYVIVDDVNDEWHIRGNDFILSPELEGRLPKLVQESRKEIEALIRERSQAKVERDYARADEIRSDLFDTYNIKLDDRIKEWSIIGFDYGDDGDEFLSDDHDGSSKIPFEENEFNLSKLTVVQLKEKLKQKKLPRTGKKAVLIQRILDNK